MSDLVKGSKKLDRDFYILVADANLETGLSYSHFNEKEKLLIRKDYAKVILGIKNGDASLDIGNVLNDYGKILDPKSKSKGFLTSYLNYVYSSIPQLEEKKETPKSNKIKFDPKNTEAVQVALFGDSPTYYVMLDSLVDGKRGFDNRKKKYFNNLALKEADIEVADEDKAAWENYKNTIANVFNNDGVVTENEYWDLNNVGFISPEAYFHTTMTDSELAKYKEEHPELTPEEKAAKDAKDQTAKFYAYLKQTYPIPLKQLKRVNSTFRFTNELEIIILDLLGKLTPDEIGGLITAGLLRSPGFKYSSYKALQSNGLKYLMLDRSFNTTLKYFTRYLWAKHDLEETSNGFYYIPGSYNKNNLTIITYNPDSELYSVQSVLALPSYFKKVYNDFTTSQGTDAGGIGEYTDFFNNARLLFATTYKRGGILKAEEGLNTRTLVSGIKYTTASDTEGWYDTVFSKYYLNLLTKLGSATTDEERLTIIDDINKMLTTHAGFFNYLSSLTGDNGGFNKAFYGINNDIKNYQTRINTDYIYVNTSGITNAYDNGRYKRVATSGGSSDSKAKNYAPDDLFSAITNDRRILGKDLDFSNELLTKIKADLNALGYDIELDDVTKYYMLKLLEKSEDSVVEEPVEEKPEPVEDSPELPVLPEGLKGKDGWVWHPLLNKWVNSRENKVWNNDQIEDYVTHVGTGLNNKLTSNLSKRKDISDFIRINNTLKANTASSQSEDILTDIITPLKTAGDASVPLLDGFTHKMNVASSGADYINKVLNTNLHSDLSTYIATNLQAFKNEMDLLRVASLESTQTIAKSRELARLTRQKYMDERIKTFNANLDAIANTHNLINQWKAYNTTNLANNLTKLGDYFIDKEQKLKQERTMAQSTFNLIAAQNIIDEHMNNAYNLWILDPNNTKGLTYATIKAAWEASPAYSLAQTEANNKATRYLAENNIYYPYKIQGGYYPINYYV